MVNREENFSHLIDDRVRSLALASVEERVRFINEEQDYNLPYGNDLHETLEELLTYGSGAIRPRCLRVLARSGMAKSFLLDLFAKRHPKRYDKLSKATIMPVVLVETPNAPTPDALIHAILHKIEAPIPQAKRIRLQYVCLGLLRDLGTLMLMFDEAQRAEFPNDTSAALVFETMKWFAGELRVPVVVAGTPAMNRFFRADEQLETRFQPYELPVWENNEDFLQMVSTVLAYMPMREPPDEAIFSAEVGEHLLKVAGRTTAQIVGALKGLAVKCLRDGHEVLTAKHLLSLS